MDWLGGGRGFWRRIGWMQCMLRGGDWAGRGMNSSCSSS